ncbi:hypothetical protein ECZU06_50330 [Escherichia coli]|nr:hypothetical protein ECZU06_50330 [Escherichia coli]
MRPSLSFGKPSGSTHEFSTTHELPSAIVRRLCTLSKVSRPHSVISRFCPAAYTDTTS